MITFIIIIIDGRKQKLPTRTLYRVIVSRAQREKWRTESVDVYISLLIDASFIQGRSIRRPFL